ncbi:MAG TPA: sugar phosphate isomerase/epimerase [Castellaniella sp.]|jgi:sugar phosphate isomerase/epimerase|nr:sugar phosphate isomerase/epimerase [Castellaniella sp.]
MQRHYSLAQLTTLSLAPPAMIETAARAGYEGCGLRLLPFTPDGVAYDLMADAPLLRETLAAQRDTGVRVGDLEIIRLNERFDVAAYGAFFEVAQRLGAENVLVAGEDPDEGRLTESFARLCEAAGSHGLTVDMEFMPWLAVDRLSRARRVIEAAGRDNGGVLIDPLHFARSASTLEELAELPGARVHYAQICDAPAGIPATTAEMIHTSRCARLLPGEGDIALGEIFARLPRDIPISIEIPNDARLAEMGPEAWARRCLEASKRFFDAG